MHCNTAPFDNNDLRMALKYAMDRERCCKILGGYGKVGNDFPINSTYALFPEASSSAPTIRTRRPSTTRSPAIDGSVLLRTSDVAFPGAVDAAVLYQESAKKAGITIEVKREPGDGYWSNVWNKQPFSTSYWGGRPTQDQMYSTAYLLEGRLERHAVPASGFRQGAARGPLGTRRDQAQGDVRSMAMMVRDEGGVILPMFNDFVNATTKQVKGYVDDRQRHVERLRRNPRLARRLMAAGPINVRRQSAETLAAHARPARGAALALKLVCFWPFRS
jgi:peptide/nickel transport system substrate-binding protein